MKLFYRVCYTDVVPAGDQKSGAPRSPSPLRRPGYRRYDASALAWSGSASTLRAVGCRWLAGAGHPQPHRGLHQPSPRCAHSCSVAQSRGMRSCAGWSMPRPPPPSPHPSSTSSSLIAGQEGRTRARSAAPRTSPSAPRVASAPLFLLTMRCVIPLGQSLPSILVTLRRRPCPLFRGRPARVRRTPRRCAS